MPDPSANHLTQLLPVPVTMLTCEEVLIDHDNSPQVHGAFDTIQLPSVPASAAFILFLRFSNVVGAWSFRVEQVDARRDELLSSIEVIDEGGSARLRSLDIRLSLADMSFPCFGYYELRIWGNELYFGRVGLCVVPGARRILKATGCNFDDSSVISDLRATAGRFGIASLLDHRVHLLRPLTVTLEKQKRCFIARCEEFPEFGQAVAPMAAVDMLRRALSESYVKLRLASRSKQQEVPEEEYFWERLFSLTGSPDHNS